MPRRLAAILAADVVGYSRLMEHDEPGTLAALKAHRTNVIDPKIMEHEGRIVKLTGDGILAEFPSVVNAVACAIDIQRGMEARNANVIEENSIRFRIGVNIGDIMAEDGDVFGDGVNVAARLEGFAVPGGIAVSSSVRDHVGNRLGVHFEDMGEQSLKNIAQPVRVYYVLPDVRASAQVSAHRKSSARGGGKPVIAVLPFTNLSGDPEQQYFSDGISEDILTELARFRQLHVVARNSSFRFRGTDMDILRTGEELGVHYLVGGSVRKVGDRIRITAQLVDAAILL
jgi:adenylate cyclase